VVKTYTVFSDVSMYVKDVKSDKIIGNLRGVQFNPKKFEGKVVFKDLTVDKLPDDYTFKLMKVDDDGKSVVVELKDIQLTDDYELDTVLDFEYNESNENIKDAGGK